MQATVTVLAGCSRLQVARALAHPSSPGQDDLLHGGHALDHAALSDAADEPAQGPGPGPQLVRLGPGAPSIQVHLRGRLQAGTAYEVTVHPAVAWPANKLINA